MEIISNWHFRGHFPLTSIPFIPFFSLTSTLATISPYSYSVLISLLTSLVMSFVCWMIHYSLDRSVTLNSSTCDCQRDISNLRCPKRTPRTSPYHSPSQLIPLPAAKFKNSSGIFDSTFQLASNSANPAVLSSKYIRNLPFLTVCMYCYPWSKPYGSEQIGFDLNNLQQEKELSIFTVLSVVYYVLNQSIVVT